MKLRAGFVSNSSSSSFLVCCKSYEDLKRFIPFTGANEFLNDIKKCSDKEALNLLKNCLEDSRMYFEWDREDAEEGSHSNYHSNYFEESPAMKLYYSDLMSTEDFYLLYSDSSEVKEREYTRVAKNILKTLKNKYSEIGFVEYGNDVSDREIEGYMEYEFMNFLEADPEKKICVIRKSNH